MSLLIIIAGIAFAFLIISCITLAILAYGVYYVHKYK